MGEFGFHLKYERKAGGDPKQRQGQSKQVTATRTFGRAEAGRDGAADDRYRARCSAACFAGRYLARQVARGRDSKGFLKNLADAGGQASHA